MINQPWDIRCHRDLHVCGLLNIEGFKEGRQLVGDFAIEGIFFFSHETEGRFQSKHLPYLTSNPTEISGKLLTSWNYNFSF